MQAGGLRAAWCASSCTAAKFVADNVIAARASAAALTARTTNDRREGWRKNGKKEVMA
jgi:hypothetical protein